MWRIEEGNHDVLLRPFMMTTTAIFRKNNTLVPDKQVLRFLVPDKQVRTTNSSMPQSMLLFVGSIRPSDDLPCPSTNSPGKPVSRETKTR